MNLFKNYFYTIFKLIDYLSELINNNFFEYILSIIPT